MGLISEAISEEAASSIPGPSCSVARLMLTLDKADRDELNEWFLSDTAHTAITRGLAKIGAKAKAAKDPNAGLWTVRPENVRRHRAVVKGIPSPNPCSCLERNPELLPVKAAPLTRANATEAVSEHRRTVTKARKR